MRTEHFDYFMSVAKEGSFSKAARKLYLSEPTLNKNITSFETELGFKLFIRSKRQLILTPEGTAFLPLAEKITETINESIASVKKLTNENNAILRINHVALDSDPLLDKVIAQLKKKMPSIDIVMYEADPKNYRERLLDDLHDTDIEITILTDSEDIPSALDHKVICDLIETVIVSANHRFAKMDSITLTDLDGKKLVFSSQVPNEAHLQLIKAIENDAEHSVERLFVNSISSGLRLVEQGGGFLVKTSMFNVPEGFVAIPLKTNFKPRLVMLWSKNNKRESLLAFLQTFDKMEHELHQL